MELGAYSNRDFDRGAPLWKEALWRLCQGFFFQPLWHLPSSVRVFWLRRFGAKIGRGAVIRAGVNVHFPWRLEMGEHVWLGEDVVLLNLAPIRLGSNVCVSQRAFLCTGSHDYRKPGFDLQTSPIRVGNGSWIAAMAFIGPGVEIGAGSVVAAGAVVIKPVAGGVVVAGNPAQELAREHPAS